jgi:spore germination protein YaaH
MSDLPPDADLAPAPTTLPPPSPRGPEDPTVPTHGASLDRELADPTAPTSRAAAATGTDAEVAEPEAPVGGPEPSAEEPGEGGPPRLRGRTRVLVLAACAVVTVLAAVVLLVRSREEAGAPRPEPGLDAWAPYWALDASLPEVGRRAGELHELSPFWFTAERADSIVADEHAPKADTAAFLRRARAAGARIVPSVVDGMAAGAMAAVLADPGQRAVHVKALADFAAKGDYAGLDLDYESFAFKDDRSTWATTRPAWVAFVGELAKRLHADGRTLTVSVPPVYDDGQTDESGYWVYDYGAITPLVDRVRVMAYDYSTADPGPIAPLEWVQQAIDGTAKASGDASKLVLGVPAYGYNWVLSTVGTCPAAAEGRTNVSASAATDLAKRRGATPVYDASIGEWSFSYQLPVSDGTTSCTQTRQVRYVDGDGALARRDLAVAHGFAGSSLWAFGYEDDAFWAGLDQPSQS